MVSIRINFRNFARLFTHSVSNMKIIVNNIPCETSIATLAQLAEEHMLPARGVAVAVNNKMVPRSQWAEFSLCDGQQITILKAFSGG